MLRREGDSPFAAFSNPRGVGAYYAEVAHEQAIQGRNRLEAAKARQAAIDNDPRMFDYDAVDMATEEGISWPQFVLECLRVRPVKLGAPTMRTESKREAYILADKLGYDSVALEEPISCGTASYDRLPRWVEIDSPQQLGVGASSLERFAGHAGSVVTAVSTVECS